MLSGFNLLLLLIISFHSTFSISSKCCGEGEVLILNNNVTCNGPSSVVVNDYFNNCTEDKQYCEDVNAKGIIYKVFCNGSYENTNKFAISKCCPYNMSYNSHNHSCEETEDIFNRYDYNHVARIGLSQCDNTKVIMDYITANPPDIINGTAIVNGLEFEADQFCVDNDVSSNKYVIRVCVSNEICGVTIPCMRKCCPDGTHYGLKRTCEPSSATVDWNRLPGQRKGNFSCN